MQYDCVVVGGGILGLAVARTLSRVRAGASIALVEKEHRLAAHQTGRNSGVIHSGIYYRPGSRKARYCLRGRRDLVAFARRRGIPHEVCGKLIAAVSRDEESRLRFLHARGKAHGLAVTWMDAAAARGLEPHLACHAAVRVPETGIIDYVSVAQALAEDCRDRGVELRMGERVIDMRREGGGHVLRTPHGRLRTRRLVTCGGLYSDRLARMEGDRLDARIVPFRGEYYELVPERAGLVRDLIYPVPDPAFPFLGVHLTRMIDGGIHAGPNAVFAFGREGYRHRDVHLGDLAESLRWRGFWRLAARHWRSGIEEFLRSLSKRRFARSLQRLVPEIQAQDLVPSRAGVRAQAIDANGGLVDDFRFVEREGALHVVNAPSPAATACLAIARAIVRRLERGPGRLRP